MRRLLLTNSFSNLSVFFVKLCAAFILTPVIVHALGKYDYGLWEIVFSVVGYMGMLDLGMRPAVVRYVAKFKAENDRISLEQLYSSVLVFNCLIGIICFVALLLWGFVSPLLLAKQAATPEHYFFFFFIISVQVLFQFPGYVAECFHEGHQRYWFMNSLTIINTVIGNTITYFLLKNGYGLLTLAFMNALGISLKYVLYHLALGLKRFGGFRWQRAMVSLALFKQMLVFGSKTFVQSLAGMVTENANVSIIGYLLGASMVPFYSIPAQLISYVRRLTMTTTNVFMPMFSHLHASHQQNELKALYLNASRYIIGCTYPLMIGAWLLGAPFLSIWVGGEIAEQGSAILGILASAFLVLSIHPLHQRYLVGIDKVAFLAKIRVASSVFFLVNSVILVYFLGIKGAALALLVTYAAFEPFVLQFTCRHLEIPIVNYIRQVLLPVLVPSAVLVAALKLAISFFTLATYPVIIGIALAGGIIYLAVFLVVSLNGEERYFIFKTMPGKMIAALHNLVAH